MNTFVAIKAETGVFQTGDAAKHGRSMHHNHRLLASLAEFESAEGQELGLALANTRTIYGVAHMTLLVLSVGNGVQGNAYCCTTYPKEWTNSYLKNNYLDIDPVIGIIDWGLLPVDWSCLSLRSRSARSFFQEAEMFGVGRHGVTIPIRGPRGERSLFSVTSQESKKEWLRTRASSLNDLQIFSYFLHDKVMSTSGFRDGDRRFKLSKREQECMEHLAAGKIPKQIAAALEISESAVRLYLRSAKHKLGAVTNYQAVARASVFELIQNRRSIALDLERNL